MIIASSVTGTGSGTTVIDDQGGSHPVPLEGLSVRVLSPLVLADGHTVTPGRDEVIFQQPVSLTVAVDTSPQAMAAAIAQAVPTLDEDALAAALTHP